MSRYFFDIYDGLNTLDNTGTELADIASARAMALGVLSELTLQLAPDGASKEHRVIVRTETRKSVLEAVLSLQCVVIDDSQSL